LIAWKYIPEEFTCWQKPLSSNWLGNQLTNLCMLEVNRTRCHQTDMSMTLFQRWCYHCHTHMSRHRHPWVYLDMLLYHYLEHLTRNRILD